MTFLFLRPDPWHQQIYSGRAPTLGRRFKYQVLAGVNRRIYVFAQKPLRWEGPEAADDQKQVCFDVFAEYLSRRMLDAYCRRMWHDHARQRQDAYDKRGTGSTFEPAKIISDEVYELTAPVPDVTPSPDHNHFLREITAEVEKAAGETGALL